MRICLIWIDVSSTTYNNVLRSEQNRVAIHTLHAYMHARVFLEAPLIVFCLSLKNIIPFSLAFWTMISFFLIFSGKKTQHLSLCLFSIFLWVFFENICYLGWTAERTSLVLKSNTYYGQCNEFLWFRNARRNVIDRQPYHHPADMHQNPNGNEILCSTTFRLSQ